MRDPMTWSIPLFRAFGIQVRLHVLYIVITLGMLLRTLAMPGGRNHLAEYALIWVVILFAIVLLHEFGHCFAARRVEGDAEEILMWPLGGLAYCTVPHNARANLVTVLGGPFVNVLICVITGSALMAASYVPPFNVFSTRQVYQPELHNWKTGESERPPHSDAPYFIDKKTGDRVTVIMVSEKLATGSMWAITDAGKLIEVDEPKSANYATWVLWTARVFWLSLLLLLFNLIPGFPLDGGRILQCVLWGRSGDYRAATQIACWSGLIVALVFFVISFWWNDTMLLFLAMFIVFSSYQQLMMLDHGAEEGGAFGYDFSKGYGGFGPEDDETTAPKPKRGGPIKRWLMARRARRLQKENEQRAADDLRLDALLDKIAREGKTSLTAEERRFMDRVSQRYRNR